MRAAAAVLLAASLTTGACAQGATGGGRGLQLQAQPPASPLLPPPPAPPRVAAPAAGSYEPAPTPNRDFEAPVGPRASNSPQLAPSLFTRKDLYRGEGYSGRSTSDTEVEKRVKPGAGFSLRLPLTPQ